MILLERGHALTVLDDLLDEASSGRGRMALVRGEAGIGKTALVRQFVAQIDSAHILWGGCDDLLTQRKVIDHTATVLAGSPRRANRFARLLLLNR